MNRRSRRALEVQDFAPAGTCQIVGTALALLGSAALGAGATAIAGHEAAGATKQASNAAIEQQNKALEQQKELSQPYTDLGSAAIPKYEQLLGLDAGANPNTIQQALEATPGYKFAQGQGETGILNAASASGGVSGNTLAALDKFNSGLADTTYQSQVDNIGTAVRTGQASAAGQAQNVGNASANIGSTLVNQGNTIAGIDANTVAGITKSIGNAGDQYQTSQLIDALKNQVPQQSVSL